MANEYLSRRKRMAKQNKNTNFRAWKSNKNWLYSSSVLAVLAGGTVVGQTDIQADTTTVSSAAITVTSAAGGVSSAAPSVVAPSAAAQSVAVQSVTAQSAAAPVVESSVAPSSVASSKAAAVKAAPTSTVVTPRKTSSVKSGASQAGTNSSVAVSAVQDPTASYVDAGKEQTSPTAAIVFDGFISQSLAALSKAESAAATKALLGSYNSYSNIKPELGSSYMASMVAAAQASISSAAKSKGTHVEVADWTAFSSAYANESISYIQVASGATITSPTLAYTAITTARTSELIVDLGGGVLNLGQTGLYLGKGGGANFTLTNGTVHQWGAGQQENAAANNAVINADWNPGGRIYQNAGSGTWNIFVSNLTTYGNPNASGGNNDNSETIAAKGCMLTLSGNIVGSYYAHYAEVGNWQAADYTNIDSSSTNGSTWGFIVNAANVPFATTGDGALTYYNGNGELQTMASTGGGNVLLGNRVTMKIQSRFAADGWPIFEEGRSLVTGDFLTIDADGPTGIINLSRGGGGEWCSGNYNGKQEVTLGQYATIKGSFGNYAFYVANANSTVTINHGANLNLAVTYNNPFYLGTATTIGSIISPESIVLAPASNNNGGIVDGAGELHISHTKVKSVTGTGTGQTEMSGLESTDLAYYGTANANLAVTAGTWSAWMNDDRVLTNVTDANMRSMDLTFGTPGDITINYVDVTGKVIGSYVVKASTSTGNLPGNLLNTGAPLPGDTVSALVDDYLISGLPDGYLWAPDSLLTPELIAKLQNDPTYASSVDLYGISGYSSTGQLLNMVVPIAGSNLTYYAVVIGDPNNDFTYTYVDFATGEVITTTNSNLAGNNYVGDEGKGSYVDLPTANLGYEIDFTNSYYTSVNAPSGYYFITADMNATANAGLYAGPTTVTAGSKNTVIYMISASQAAAIGWGSQVASGATSSASLAAAKQSDGLAVPNSIALLPGLGITDTFLNSLTAAQISAAFASGDLVIMVDGVRIPASSTAPVYTTSMSDPGSVHVVTYTYTDPNQLSDNPSDPVTATLNITVTSLQENVTISTAPNQTVKAGDTVQLSAAPANLTGTDAFGSAVDFSNPDTGITVSYKKYEGSLTAAQASGATAVGSGAIPTTGSGAYTLATSPTETKSYTYFVTYTYQDIISGKTVTVTHVVYQNPLAKPAISVAGSQAVTAGNTIQLSAAPSNLTATDAYGSSVSLTADNASDWTISYTKKVGNSTGASVTLPSGVTIIETLMSDKNATYTVTYTYKDPSSGVVATATQVVTLNELPPSEIAINGTNTVKAGDTIELIGEPANLVGRDSLGNAIDFSSDSLANLTITVSSKVGSNAPSATTSLPTGQTSFATSPSDLETVYTFTYTYTDPLTGETSTAVVQTVVATRLPAPTLSPKDSTVINAGGEVDLLAGLTGSNSYGEALDFTNNDVLSSTEIVVKDSKGKIISSGNGATNTKFTTDVTDSNGVFTVTYTYTDPDSLRTVTVTQKITVNEWPNPELTVSGSNTVKAGDTIELVGSPANLSGKDAQGNAIDFNAGSLGNLTITVSSKVGSNAASAPVTLTNGQTTIATSPSDLETTYTITYVYTDPMTGDKSVVVTQKVVATRLPAPTLSSKDSTTIDAGGEVNLISGLTGKDSYNNTLDFTDPEILASTSVVVTNSKGVVVSEGDAASNTVFSTNTADSDGVFIVTYTYTDPDSLRTISVTQKITVNALPLAELKVSGTNTVTAGEEIELVGSPANLSGVDGLGNAIDFSSDSLANLMITVSSQVGSGAPSVIAVLPAGQTSFATEASDPGTVYTFTYTYTDPLTGKKSVVVVRKVSVDPLPAPELSANGSTTITAGDDVGLLSNLKGKDSYGNNLDFTDSKVLAATKIVVTDSKGNIVSEGDAATLKSFTSKASDKDGVYTVTYTYTDPDSLLEITTSRKITVKALAAPSSRVLGSNTVKAGTVYELIGSPSNLVVIDAYGNTVSTADLSSIQRSNLEITVTGGEFGKNVHTITGTTTTFPLAKGAESASYTVTYIYTDPVTGVKTTVQQVLHVVPLPAPVLTVNPSQTINAGDSLDLVFDASGLTGRDSNGVNINFEDAAQLENLVISVNGVELSTGDTQFSTKPTSSSATYVITYTYTDPATGYTGSTTQTIIVKALPAPKLEVNPIEEKIEIGKMVDLLDGVSGTDSYGRTFYFTDLNQLPNLVITIDGVSTNGATTWSIPSRAEFVGPHVIRYTYTDPVTGLSVSGQRDLNVIPVYTASTSELTGDPYATTNQSVYNQVSFYGGEEAANTTQVVKGTLYANGVAIGTTTSVVVFDANGYGFVTLSYSGLDLTKYANQTLTSVAALESVAITSNGLVVKPMPEPEPDPDPVCPDPEPEPDPDPVCPDPDPEPEPDPDPVCPDPEPDPEPVYPEPVYPEPTVPNKPKPSDEFPILPAKSATPEAKEEFVSQNLPSTGEKSSLASEAGLAIMAGALTATALRKKKKKQ